MKYNIDANDHEINIRISESKGKKQALLEAFQECQEGLCSCPTQEYTKLETLEVESSGDSINLKLKSKSGQQFDEAEINKCLEYTKAKIGDH